MTTHDDAIDLDSETHIGSGDVFTLDEEDLRRRLYDTLEPVSVVGKDKPHITFETIYKSDTSFIHNSLCNLRRYTQREHTEKIQLRETLFELIARNERESTEKNHAIESLAETTKTLQISLSNITEETEKLKSSLTDSEHSRDELNNELRKREHILSQNSELLHRETDVLSQLQFAKKRNVDLEHECAVLRRKLDLGITTADTQKPRREIGISTDLYDDHSLDISEMKDQISLWRRRALLAETTSSTRKDAMETSRSAASTQVDTPRVSDAANQTGSSCTMMENREVSCLLLNDSVPSSPENSSVFLKSVSVATESPLMVNKDVFAKPGVLDRETQSSSKLRSIQSGGHSQFMVDSVSQTNDTMSSDVLSPEKSCLVQGQFRNYEKEILDLKSEVEDLHEEANDTAQWTKERLRTKEEKIRALQVNISRVEEDARIKYEHSNKEIIDLQSAISGADKRFTDFRATKEKELKGCLDEALSDNARLHEENTVLKHTSMCKIISMEIVSNQARLLFSDIERRLDQFKSGMLVHSSHSSEVKHRKGFHEVADGNISNVDFTSGDLNSFAPSYKEHKLRDSDSQQVKSDSLNHSFNEPAHQDASPMPMLFRGTNKCPELHIDETSANIEHQEYLEFIVLDLELKVSSMRVESESLRMHFEDAHSFCDIGKNMKLRGSVRILTRTQESLISYIRESDGVTNLLVRRIEYISISNEELIGHFRFLILSFELEIIRLNFLLERCEQRLDSEIPGTVGFVSRYVQTIEDDEKIRLQEELRMVKDIMSSAHKTTQEKIQRKESISQRALDQEKKRHIIEFQELNIKAQEQMRKLKHRMDREGQIKVETALKDIRHQFAQLKKLPSAILGCSQGPMYNGYRFWCSLTKELKQGELRTLTRWIITCTWVLACRCYQSVSMPYYGWTLASEFNYWRLVGCNKKIESIEHQFDLLEKKLRLSKSVSDSSHSLDESEEIRLDTNDVINPTTISASFLSNTARGDDSSKSGIWSTESPNPVSTRSSLSGKLTLPLDPGNHSVTEVALGVEQKHIHRNRSIQSPVNQSDFHPFTPLVHKEGVHNPTFSFCGTPDVLYADPTHQFHIMDPNDGLRDTSSSSVSRQINVYNRHENMVHIDSESLSLENIHGSRSREVDGHKGNLDRIRQLEDGVHEIAKDTDIETMIKIYGEYISSNVTLSLSKKWTSSRR